jgi:diketogulonate reductase-like aldo/keto reductase
MEANLDLFDWYLSDEEMDTIASIETVHRVMDWWPGNFDEDAL